MQRLVIMLAAVFILATPNVFAFASGLEDNVSGGTSSSTTGLDGQLSQDDKGVSDWIKNQRGVTSDQLNTASQTLSPLANLAGNVTGGIIVIVTFGVGLITALDLLYIAVPPVRNVLYKAGTDGTGAYTGGGVGGGYGGYGGYGRGSMGVGGASGGSNKATQWVSDEAVQCAALLGGSSQAQQQGGYGMGMQRGQLQQNVSTKSVIGTYLKKRVFFLILLAICVVILTSSILLGTGVNLAQWGLKVISTFNNYIPQ